MGCPRAWLPAVVYAEIPPELSLALEDREDHRAAVVEFRVEVGLPQALQAPSNAVTLMRLLNRQAL